jgi:RsiW-degrading membrane proteinase PrsW (M82 family)
MSLKPLEIFVFFILPFIAGGFFRWAYLDARKWTRFGAFWSLGVFVLWVLWDSPNAEVRMGVVAMLAIVGIPSLIIALLWPWLIKLACLPGKLLKCLRGGARQD